MAAVQTTASPSSSFAQQTFMRSIPCASVFGLAYAMGSKPTDPYTRGIYNKCIDRYVLGEVFLFCFDDRISLCGPKFANFGQIGA